MKNYKKFSFWAVGLFNMSFLAVFLLHGQGASAATPAYTHTATWIDRSSISVTETAPDGTKQTFTLIDTEWGDNDWNYKATGDLGGQICAANLNGFGSRQSVGFTGHGNKRGDPPWDADASKGTLHISHRPASSCSEDTKINDLSIGEYKNAAIAFTWIDSDTISKVDGDNDWTMSYDQSRQPAAGKTKWFWRVSESKESKCQDLLTVNEDNGSGILYELDDASESTSFDHPPKEIDPQQTCYLSTKDDDFQNSNKSTGIVPSGVVLGIGNVANASVAGSGHTASGGSSASGSDSASGCAANSGGWSFTWLVCPVLDAANGLSDLLIDTFEDQLAFSVGQLGDSSNPNSGSFKIHQSWAIMRNIASAFLVLVMLVMVFSQAISFGPFDAYTIRKLLPKLIAAAILIQISWAGVAWLIGLVNAIGGGLADLMYYPFGGTENMDLWHLLANAKLSNGLLATMNWGAVAVGAFVGVSFLFTILGVALSAILALFAAVVTLVFRKMLLILVLIFAPIAILLWILPGTERYFKMWRDNFIKALFMFPIAVAIVATGRIFASVVGTQDNSQFLNLVFVMIGFFGPLFILPKTFKWGGQAMQLAGGKISEAATKIGERPKKFLGTRQEGWSAERKRQSQERYTKGDKFNPRRLSSYWKRPIDLARSGQFDPTQGIGEVTIFGKTVKKASRRREEAMRNYRAAGAESEEAEVKAADQDFGLLAAQSDNHDEFARLVGGAQIGATIKWTDKYGKEQSMKVTKAMKRAGMNGMVKYGTDATFRQLGRIMNELNHSRNIEEQILAERFRDAQVSSLKPKMDFLYRGASKVPGGSDEMPDWTDIDHATGLHTGTYRLEGPVVNRVGALNPEAFATMEAPELEAMLAGLSQVATHHADAGARAAAERHLETIYDEYVNATKNDQIRRSMGASLNLTMKGHLDDTKRTERNDDRTKAGLTTHIELATPTTKTATIAAKIRDDGGFV